MNAVDRAKKQLKRWNKRLKKLRKHPDPILMHDRIADAEWRRHFYWTRLRLARRAANTSKNP